MTDEGVAIYAHSARLRWGPLRVGYGALLLSRPGCAAEETAAVRHGAPPRLDGDLLTWRNAPLGLTGSWQREAPPADATLLDLPSGAIRWSCVMPNARARLAWRDATHRGRGYAEILRLTIAPNRLPFRRLRWGRHLSDRHSVVWIEWEGETRRGWCWLDGAPRPAVRVTAAGGALDDDWAVRFTESRELTDRPPAATLGSRLTRLSRRLGWLRGMREHRLLSRSALVSAGGEPADAGWTIHEEVTW